MDEQRIREIVREELAALIRGQSEIDKTELGKVAIEAIKSLQKEYKPCLTV